MSEKLLRTKLLVPPLRPNLVSRPRLLAALDQGLANGCRLTLISAPAGFGKTTLVCEWVGHLRSAAGREGQRTPRIAWLSLDERDDDPARFLAYAVAALNQLDGVETAIGRGALAMLQSARPPPAEDVLTSLINDLAALPDEVLLILDDYHLIDTIPDDASAGVDRALTFLLEHVPPQMHMVIATRVDPNLPLARYRARGQLTELRAADLRFSSLEVADFLNRAMGLTLSPEQIATLESRTEGWVAGLQLAAISMQGQQNTARFIRSFAGSHHFVMDYLVEDVLEQQPVDVQAFLLRTAILRRLTAPLCDAVTGLDDGRAMLDMLERANLFLVPLDADRRWYRYHHLFADLLRRRLRQIRPESVAELHRRACEWYRQNGDDGEAIEHALHAEDFEQAADLLEEHIDALWARGESSKLQSWLALLPEEILFTRPTITIFQARYQCSNGRLDDAERSLEAAVRILDDGPGRVPASARRLPRSLTDAERRKAQGRIATNRALICSYLGDVPGIIQHANRALGHLPEGDLRWRSVAAILLGNAYGFQGDMTAAYEARSKALRICEAAGDIYFIILANLELAITLREQGQLQRAIEICRHQLQTAEENGLSKSRIVGWLLAIWGETLAELNHLNEGLNRAQEGFELTRRSGDPQMLGWSFMCLVRILLSRGDLTGAEEAIQKMENLAREYRMPPWIADQVATWEARLWLAQGRLQEAACWAQERALYPDARAALPEAIGFFPLLDYLVVARIRIAQGRLEEATGLLPHLLEVAAEGGRASRVVEIKILQALAFRARGDREQALSTLEEALALAEPEGFVRIFADEGPPLAPLLFEALQQGIAPKYVRLLLNAFPAVDPVQPPFPEIQSTLPNLQSAIVEPLSERELEVLQRIADGLTNREIAERLFLALNTVKAHTRNIYGKLDVHNRTQAVARARALGVLPPPDYPVD